MDKKEIKIPRPKKALPQERVVRPKNILRENVRRFIKRGERYWDIIERKKEL